jgi:hypothetical protein
LVLLRQITLKLLKAFSQTLAQLFALHRGNKQANTDTKEKSLEKIVHAIDPFLY